MNKSLLNLAMLFTMLASTSFVNAADNITKIINVTNPEQKIGIQIGDVLTRQLTVVANTTEKITPKSLPVKGTRTNGIELIAVNVSELSEKAQTLYKVDLRYQVFAHSIQPEKIYLPTEVITFVDGEDLTLPVWSFWYSPLVTSDLVDAKTTILPQVKAMLIDQHDNLLRFFAYTALFLLGFIGLIYINADRYWLPWMGGNFARAHRQIKYLAKKNTSKTDAPKEALSILHDAFNQTFGRGLYPNKIDEFLVNHKNFKKLKVEIESFFVLSNQILFSGKKEDTHKLLQKILITSKQLRDCERGV